MVWPAGQFGFDLVEGTQDAALTAIEGECPWYPDRWWCLLSHRGGIDMER